MNKAIFIPNSWGIPKNIGTTELVRQVQEKRSLNRKDHEIALECWLTDLNAKSKQTSDNKWICFFDTVSHFTELIREANDLLYKQPVGFKVVFNEADEIASLVQMDEGFLYKVGKDFGITTDLTSVVRKLEEYVCKADIRVLDIITTTAMPDDFLFDIHMFAEEMEIKMLNHVFEKHQQDGKMSLIDAERNVGEDDLLRLAVLSGLDFESFSIESIEREKDFFFFCGKTECSKAIRVGYDLMPPKGISYLIEWFYQHNF